MTKFYVSNKDAMLKAGIAEGKSGEVAAQILNTAESFEIIDIHTQFDGRTVFVTNLEGATINSIVVLRHSDMAFISEVK